MAPRLNYNHLSPKAVKALLALSEAAIDSDLGATLVDLVKLRASQVNGCLFCVDMHSKEGKLHGEKELRRHHLALWRESPLFSAREKAALEWTELLTQLPKHGIDDAAYAKISEHFSEKEISDLTFIIGSIGVWNRLGVAFRAVPGSMDKYLGLDKAGLD